MSPPQSSILEWIHDSDDKGHVWSFTFTLLQLNLYTDFFEQLLLCEVLDEDHVLSRKVIDPLRADIRDIFLLSRHPNPDSNAPTEAVKIKGGDLALLILEALEKIASVEENEVVQEGWVASEVSDWNTILENPVGLDPSTVVDTAPHFLRRTPKQIAGDLPSWLRVVHIESIMRQDLARGFVNYQTRLREKLEGMDVSDLRGKLPPHRALARRVLSIISKEDLIDEMVKPRVTYYGTPLSSVSYILRFGFRMTGNIVDGKVIASPRSGFVFNRGIYSSDRAGYAMAYATGQRQRTPVGDIPTMRLFVCATIMGRTLSGGNEAVDQSHPVHGPLVEGYDSHFDGGYEYVAHSERAMLPCYVVHLDVGPERAASMLQWIEENKQRASNDKPKVDPRLEGMTNEKNKTPGDVKREKEAKKAAAMNWFPYGFGSASGTNFIIEEIGEVSDDKEEHGE
ncbi:hypothetical protein B0T26DRAFT_766482 [Lasiosphaeria miniovina]|uniref:PARP catalytic domain-containing protein n=1 Tax=Lasiosphaeria miniovina TaxID=1954250 RepID=A0AA40B4Y7_9PEZI|nr:uncharacterized protein B0T26DRAFT_766482 [Lasiosphaeria miniovina]KAK0727814.1 hypothetical protein B0T26DRAFT_766482 [Lasiosphaeria miniovina]